MLLLPVAKLDRLCHWRRLFGCGAGARRLLLIVKDHMIAEALNGAGAKRALIAGETRRLSMLLIVMP